MKNALFIEYCIINKFATAIFTVVILKFIYLNYNFIISPCTFAPETSVHATQIVYPESFFFVTSISSFINK